MARGDISAAEVYADREMFNRLGYGIMDISFGSAGIGSENIRDFSYLITPDEDNKFYRRKVYDLVGRYYTNTLAKAIWDELINHKWVMSERVGHEIDLKTAAEDWFKNHSHGFFKEWTFQQPEVPERIRQSSQEGREIAGVVAGTLIPHWRELLTAGFAITDVAKAAIVEAVHPGVWKKAGLTPPKNRRLVSAPRFFKRRKVATSPQEEPPYLSVKRVDAKSLKEGSYFVRMVAHLTGHDPTTPEEAERRWQEILEHKWHLSEKTGRDVGLQAAALDYFRRLNLVREVETGEKN